MVQWSEVNDQVMDVLTKRYGSAVAVADALGVNRSQVSRWFQSGQVPGIDALQRITKACPEAGAIVRSMF